MRRQFIQGIGSVLLLAVSLQAHPEESAPLSRKYTGDTLKLDSAEFKTSTLFPVRSVLGKAMTDARVDLHCPADFQANMASFVCVYSVKSFIGREPSTGNRIWEIEDAIELEIRPGSGYRLLTTARENCESMAAPLQTLLTIGIWHQNNNPGEFSYGDNFLTAWAIDPEKRNFQSVSPASVKCKIINPPGTSPD